MVQGKYGFKLLAVDVPTATGKEQRLFVDGNDQVYSRGGVMSELRDPFLRVSPSASVHGTLSRAWQHAVAFSSHAKIQLDQAADLSSH